MTSKLTRPRSHVEAVPGRKSYVRDAEWIVQLLEHGLLASLIRAAAADPAAADADLLLGPAEGRADPAGHPAGADAGGCLDQAALGRLLAARAIPRAMIDDLGISAALLFPCKAAARKPRGAAAPFA